MSTSQKGSSTKDVSDKFLCTICERKFDSQVHLDLHIPKHIAVCKMCEHVFSNEYGFINHLLGTNSVKIYKCCLCPKEYTNSSKLKFHSVQHTGKWPFTCKLCRKGFVYKRQFKKHIAEHVGKLWFKCEYCGKGSGNLNELKLHFWANHPSTEHRKFSRSLVVNPAEIQEICEDLLPVGLEAFMRRLRPVNQSKVENAREEKLFRSTSKVPIELKVQPHGSRTQLGVATLLSPLQLRSQSQLLQNVAEMQKESYFPSVSRARSETVIYNGSGFFSESTVQLNRLVQASDLTVLSSGLKTLCDLKILPKVSRSSNEAILPKGSESSSALTLPNVSESSSELALPNGSGSLSELTLSSRSEPLRELTLPSGSGSPNKLAVMLGSDSSREVNRVRRCDLESPDKFIFSTKRSCPENFVLYFPNELKPSSHRLIFPGKFEESLPILAIPKISRLQSSLEIANEIEMPAPDQRALNKLGFRKRYSKLVRLKDSLFNLENITCNISENRLIVEEEPAPPNESLKVNKEQDVLGNEPEHLICEWDDFYAYLVRTTPKVFQGLR